MIIHGLDSNNFIVPLRVDANGRILTNGFPHSIYDELSPTDANYSGLANNATVVLRTAPAGKTLYLTSLYMSISNQSGGGNLMYVEILNAALAVQYDWQAPAVNTQILSTSLSFVVPIKIQTGWRIQVRSPVLNLFARATMTGYEI